MIDRILDIVFPIIMFICIIFFFICIGMLGWAFLGPKPESVSLVINEWECTKIDKIHGTRVIMVGKILVPQPYTSTICTQYTKK